MLIFIIGILILFTVCGCAMWLKYGTYAQYGKIIGRTYEVLIERYGESNNIVHSERYSEVYYDTLKFICVGEEHTSVYVSIIEDEKIRFGIFNIGVGSSKHIVETVFYLKERLIVEEENQFGIRDGGYHITFEYDENDMVERMYVSFQG